jgi:hypothetical protein
MGENEETGDIGQKQASTGNAPQQVRYPHVIAETPENGLTMGENVETGNFGQKWASVGKRSTTGTLPRLTAENPENGLTMGENMEMGDFGKMGQASENLSVGTTCYSGNT